jgi:hypothetical protein
MEIARDPQFYITSGTFPTTITENPDTGVSTNGIITVGFTDAAK